MYIIYNHYCAENVKMRSNKEIQNIKTTIYIINMARTEALWGADWPVNDWFIQTSSNVNEESLWSEHEDVMFSKGVTSVLKF